MEKEQNNNVLLSAAAVAKPKTMGRPKKNSKVKEVYESNIDYAIIVNGDNLNYIVNILTERHKKNIRNYKVAIDKQEEIANINFMIESGLKLSKIQENLLNRVNNPPPEQFELPFTIIKERRRGTVNNSNTSGLIKPSLESQLGPESSD